MKKKGNILLVIILILALAVGAGAVGFGIMTMRNRQIYTKSIEMGDKYLASGDYDNAILMYQEAIRKDETNEQGYLKLANAYAEQGYLTLAIDTLENGYSKTKGERIRGMLLVYKNVGNNGETGTKDPLLNKSLLNKVTTTPYGDYVSKNEIVETRTGPKGEAIIRVKGVSADLVYSNIENLPAIVIGDKIQDYAYPTEIRFDNLTGLLGVTGTVTYDQLKTLEFNDVQLIQAGGTGYQLRLIYLGSTLLVPCDKDGTVSTDAACVMETQMNESLTNLPGEGSGTEVMGMVEDAQTGRGVPDVKLSFYDGNVAGAEPIATVQTDDNGEYSLNLEEGSYTVVISGNGYVDIEKEIRVGSYSRNQEEDFIVSAESSGEIRIVLEWDSPECDLDSYLVSGDNWMNYGNREMYLDGKLAASLDRDARSGHGVETTTIYDMSGSFIFHVFDYQLSGGMQTSGATVTIYAPGEAPMEVSIPSDAGNCWYVCEVNEGKVSITNYMTDVQSSYAPK